MKLPCRIVAILERAPTERSQPKLLGPTSQFRTRKHVNNYVSYVRDLKSQGYHMEVGGTTETVPACQPEETAVEPRIKARTRPFPSEYGVGHWERSTQDSRIFLI